MRQHADPEKESVTDPFLTPPEAFEKDQLDLYQRAQPQHGRSFFVPKSTIPILPRAYQPRRCRGTAQAPDQASSPTNSSLESMQLAAETSSHRRFDGSVGCDLASPDVHCHSPRNICGVGPYLVVTSTVDARGDPVKRREKRPRPLIRSYSRRADRRRRANQAPGVRATPRMWACAGENRRGA